MKFRTSTHFAKLIIPAGILGTWVGSASAKGHEGHEPKMQVNSWCKAGPAGASTSAAVSVGKSRPALPCCLWGRMLKHCAMLPSLWHKTHRGAFRYKQCGLLLQTPTGILTCSQSILCSAAAVTVTVAATVCHCPITLTITITHTLNHTHTQSHHHSHTHSLIPFAEEKYWS